MVEVRELRLADYESAWRLWLETPGMRISAADSEEGVAVFLRRNPGLSFAAWDGVELIGTILGGHDGRRGFLYHLAVRPEKQGRGVGRRLTESCLAALAAQGIDKCHLFVLADNVQAKGFWSRLGFSCRNDIQTYSRNTMGNE